MKKPLPLSAHIISSEQYDAKKLKRLFLLTKRIKESDKKYRQLLKGKIVATLFFEPSTRTRLSFEAAALRLGANLISTENAAANSSGIKGETIEDTIATVQNYADLIIMRHSDDEAAEKAIRLARVPFISAGSGKKEHPTQALLDLFTILDKKEHLDKLKIALVGDLKYGRTIHSLVKLILNFKGINFYAFPACKLNLPKEYITEIKKRGGTYQEVTSWKELPRNLDFIYQTRVQKERLCGEIFTQEEETKCYLNKKVMAQFGQDTFVLHPLPRNGEISSDFDQDKRAIYFEQAANGMYLRMALLLQLLGKI